LYARGIPRAWGQCERDKEPFAIPTALAVADNLDCLKKGLSVFRKEAGRDVLMA